MNYFDNINFKYTGQPDTLFIIDTNYILYAYQSYSLSDKYVEALQSQDIYIPFVVFIEFINQIDKIKFNTSEALRKTQNQINRINTEDIFTEEFVRSKIKGNLFDTKALDGNKGLRFEEEVNKEINQLTSRISNDINNELKLINESIKKNAELFREQNQNHFNHENYESNLTKLDNDFNIIFNKSLGEKYTPENISVFLKDLDYRYDNKIPPGFDDNSKKHKETGEAKMKFYGDIKFESRGGDLILWKDLINYVKQNNDSFNNVVIVTDDSTEDWIIKSRNKEINPLLKFEFLEKTNKPLDIISVQDFIESSTIDDESKDLIRKELEITKELNRKELERAKELEELKQLEDKKIVFTFDNEDFGTQTQADMMKHVFERIINEYISDINDLPRLSCLVTTDELKNKKSAIFDRIKVLNIHSVDNLVLGTRLSFSDKMVYIKNLFSSVDLDLDILSFEDPMLQKKWEDVK